MQKEILVETSHAINHKEKEFFEGLGLEISSDYLFFVEPMLKKDRKILTEGAVEGIQEEVAEIKNNNKESKVITFVQFIKGSKRNIEQIEMAMRCNMFDGSDGVCIYETYPKQSEKDFSEEIDGFIEVTGDLDKYLVIEIDGNEALEKLVSALGKGLRKIVLVAGAYKNNILWIQMLEKIRKANAKSFIVFLKRMNPHTKEAYIPRGVKFSADVLVHGFFHGRKPKKRVNYYFDKSDGFYKDKSALPLTAVIFSDKKLNKLSKQFKENSIEEYPLSRVCSIEEGRLYCKEHIRKLVLDTK